MEEFILQINRTKAPLNLKVMSLQMRVTLEKRKEINKIDIYII